MPTLSYGLNLTKKSNAPKAIPAKRKAIFEEDDDPELEGTGPTAGEDVEEIGVFDEASIETRSQTRPASENLKHNGVKKAKTNISLYGDISSAHSSRKHHEEATSIDPSIYDYDAAFEALHATSAKKEAAKAEDVAARKPKYMSNLLAAADVRKRDQLRAKEKLLMKEREAEGDEYADKEKFVTEAYKTQQEEVRRLEEEEKLREEEEQRRRKGRGMIGFYRDVLERDERKHEEVMAAAAENKNRQEEATDEQEGEKEKTEAEIARELKAQGRDVVINDEGQVVDKRQLLSAGLNVVPKPRATKPDSGAAQSTLRPAYQSGLQGKAASQKAMRERQTRMLQEQLMQASEQAAAEEEEKKTALEKAAKSKKSEGEISSAKERYLQRKREAAQQSKTEA
ncbi:MAG: hypothetical protein M1816_004344 [Peltula sp. TS41687]|nr:MAG: hypothetical protein M1816_004344 [Peltula sp. TS41687]